MHTCRQQQLHLAAGKQQSITVYPRGEQAGGAQADRRTSSWATAHIQAQAAVAALLFTTGRPLAPPTVPLAQLMLPYNSSLGCSTG